MVVAAAAAGAIAAPPAVTKAPGPRWKIQYFYDKDDSEFVINDLAFSSPERGIAAGYVASKKGKAKGMVVITRNGGATWVQVPVDDIPISLFLLDDSLGWMVTSKGLWRTDEAGRTWKKVKGMQGLRRAYFLDANHGFITGAPKLFKETKDGGKTWTDVAGMDELKMAPENTYFDWIEWPTATRAIVLGANVAPRREFGNFMDPEMLSRRREWPGLNITLETNDSGKTWIPQTAPTFGRFLRLRIAKDMRVGLSLIGFVNTFQYPSEVYLVNAKGGSTRIYRERNRNVTDVVWFGKQSLIVAVEPPGKLHQLPIPGKVHVLRSADQKQWEEMKVDYRAFGLRAMLATSGEDAWVATDSGQILKLIK